MFKVTPNPPGTPDLKLNQAAQRALDHYLNPSSAKTAMSSRRNSAALHAKEERDEKGEDGGADRKQHGGKHDRDGNEGGAANDARRQEATEDATQDLADKKDEDEAAEHQGRQPLVIGQRNR